MDLHVQLTPAHRGFVARARIHGLVVILAGVMSACGQNAQDQGLARRLANNETRQEAVAEILASGEEKIPLLLSWTRIPLDRLNAFPPHRMDVYELRIGLADAFGALRAREAIPFLVTNILLKRHRAVDLAPWLKVAEVVSETFPAIAALISIGPDASSALVQKSIGRMTPEERLATIVVISRTSEVPGARALLTSALSGGVLQSDWAKEGLKLMDNRP